MAAPTGLSHPRVGSAELPLSFNTVGLCLGFFLILSKRKLSYNLDT